MRKTTPALSQSLSTRTEEFSPKELPLPAPTEAPPVALRPSHPADRIKEALLRWLEEEM